MIDFIGKKKIFFSISIALIVITIVFAIVFGVNVDIKFKGGSIVTYSYENTVDADAIAKTVETALNRKAGVQLAEGVTNSVVVTLAGSESLSLDQQAALNEALYAAYPDAKLQQISSSNVEPVMGREFFQKCLVAVAFAAVLMVIYVGFRFRRIGGISAGTMAVVALLHDIAMVFATFIIFRMPIDDNFIAVALTILGYSLNDTIVIYDRIRENDRIYGAKKTIGEIVNLSINQSLARTIMTSVTTITALVVVCVVAVVFNVRSILAFAFPMIIGMLSGVYSSLCISGPLWVMWKEYSAKHNKGGKAKNKAGKINV